MLPKTIDNDLAGTDATIGFTTALEVATDAIDRLHSTAHSHHRIIVAELMGHGAGWLALGAGLAGGADVILIPEIPYSVPAIAAAIKERARRGTNFSIVAVAEGARSVEDAWARALAEGRADRAKDPAAREAAKAEVELLDAQHTGQHAPAGPPAGAAHRSRVTGLDPRLHPARRHAVPGRPAAGDAAGQRGGRPGRRRGRSGSWSRLAATRPRRCRSTRSPASASASRPTTRGSRPRATWGPASATEDPQPNASVRFAGLCYGVPGRSRGWVARTPMSTRFEPFRSMNATSRGLSQPAAC